MAGESALIVIDPRRIELAEMADVHLTPRPGTNVPLLSAMAWVILEERLFDSAFVGKRVDGWSAFYRSLGTFRPEDVAGICGVSAELIRTAARIYAMSKPAMCFHGLGVTEHVQGTDGAICLANLALLTGNLGKPGCGVNPLRGQNNVQGAAHMGCEPSNLTGFIPLQAGRPAFEQAWGTPLPNKSGLNLMQMMDAANEGRLKAMWAIGYDVSLTNPNADATRRALTAMELVIVQDLFLNRVAEQAHVFFPAASSFEKDGTFMNAERRVQRVRKAVEPPGQARPDWQIICNLAAEMGFGTKFSFGSPREVWDEVREVWPAGRGITYERLERDGGLQWPCPSEDHPGTPILHMEVFPKGPRASLQPVNYTPTDETTSDRFPLLLTTGRTLYQFNAGTMTMRTPNASLRPSDVLEISPADASQFGVHDGETVRVTSRWGEATLPARLSASVRPGELFTTFHSAGLLLNRLTGNHRDARVDTPEYKVTAVRVEPVVTLVV